MCNEYEHDIFFPSSPFERQIQIEDRQPGNDGWLDLSTIICRAGPRHCEQCSKTLVIDGILMVDGYVYVYIIYIYIYLYNCNQSHPICHFLQQFPSGRNLPGRLLWQLPCDQLLFGAHLQKAVLKEIAAEAVIASCLYTVGKLAGSGTASSSINFNQLLSFLPAQQFTHRRRWAQSKLHDAFWFGCRPCVRNCIYVLCNELQCMKHKFMICMIIHLCIFSTIFMWSVPCVFIWPITDCRLSQDPASYAQLLYCKQSHDECHDVGLHYCLGSLACFNGCLKPSYTAVKNGLNLDPQVPQVIMVLQFSLYKIASVGYPPFLRRKTSSGLRSSGCLGPAANWT